MAVAALAGMLLSSCDRLSGPEDSSSVELQLKPDSASIAVKDTVQFTASVVDGSGSELSGYKVTWKVADSVAAAVDANGTFVGMSPGNTEVSATASISASDRSLTSSSAVEVTPRRVSAVKISPTSPTIQRGDTIELSANVTDGSGEQIDRPVKWSISDTSIATIDSDGRLVGQNQGETQVTARSTSVADTTGVSVALTPVGAVTVTPDTAVLAEGEIVQLEASAVDTAGNDIERSVSWTSSNSSVATVDPLGQVQARVRGEAVITATSGEQSDSSRIIVQDASSQTTGGLRVITSTTGENLDSDGYTVSVDTDAHRSLGLNDTTSYSGVAAEDHTVELSGVAANCAVTGANPRTLTVVEGDTVSSSFDLNCESTTSNVTPVFSDGFESGDLSHTENGYSWAQTRGVTSLSPRSGSYALDMTFDAVADGDDDTIFREIVLGSDVKEIWVEYSLRVPENFHHRTQSGPTNNKFFQVYRSPRGGSEAGVIAEHESPDGSGNSDMLRWTYQNPDRFNNWSNSLEVDNVEVDNVIAVSEQGTYHQWRWHVKVFSDSLTVNDNRAEDGWDGVLEIWKDGNLLFSRTDAPIGNPDASLNYMDTIRFLGWSNSGYDQQTRFSIDNVKIYTSDPGW